MLKIFEEEPLIDGNLKNKEKWDKIKHLYYKSFEFSFEKIYKKIYLFIDHNIKPEANSRETIFNEKRDFGEIQDEIVNMNLEAESLEDYSEEAAKLFYFHYSEYNFENEKEFIIDILENSREKIKDENDFLIFVSKQKLKIISSNLNKNLGRKFSLNDDYNFLNVNWIIEKFTFENFEDSDFQLEIYNFMLHLELLRILLKNKFNNEALKAEYKRMIIEKLNISDSDIDDIRLNCLLLEKKINDDDPLIEICARYYSNDILDNYYSIFKKYYDFLENNKNGMKFSEFLIDEKFQKAMLDQNSELNLKFDKFFSYASSFSSNNYAITFYRKLHMLYYFQNRIKILADSIIAYCNFFANQTSHDIKKYNDQFWEERKFGINRLYEQYEGYKNFYQFKSIEDIIGNRINNNIENKNNFNTDYNNKDYLYHILEERVANKFDIYLDREFEENRKIFKEVIEIREILEKLAYKDSTLFLLKKEHKSLKELDEQGNNSEILILLDRIINFFSSFENKNLINNSQMNDKYDVEIHAEPKYIKRSQYIHYFKNLLIYNLNKINQSEIKKFDLVKDYLIIYEKLGSRKAKINKINSDVVRLRFAEELKNLDRCLSLINIVFKPEHFEDDKIDLEYIQKHDIDFSEEYSQKKNHFENDINSNKKLSQKQDIKYIQIKNENHINNQNINHEEVSIINNINNSNQYSMSNFNINASFSKLADQKLSSELFLNKNSPNESLDYPYLKKNKENESKINSDSINLNTNFIEFLNNKTFNKEKNSTIENSKSISHIIEYNEEKEEHNLSELEKERLRFDDKPEGFFLRYLKEGIYIISASRKYNKNQTIIDTRNIFFEDDMEFNFKNFENVDIKFRELYDNIITTYHKQMNQSHLANNLIKNIGIYLNNKRFASALITMENVLTIYEPINVNFLKYLHEKTQIAARKIKDKSIIFLIGNTGSGKSSITLYLSGLRLVLNNNLIQVKDPSEIKNPDLLEVIPSKKWVSETRYINPIENSLVDLKINYISEEENYIVCDSPGLEENRNVETEISNNLGILEGIQNCGAIRPVFILTPKFDERKQGFKRIARSLMNFLKHPIDYIKQFTFCLNQCTEIEYQKFKEDLDEFTNDIRANLTDSEKNDIAYAKFLHEFCKKLKKNLRRIDPLDNEFRSVVEYLLDKKEIKYPRDIFYLHYSEQMSIKVKEYLTSSFEIIKQIIKKKKKEVKNIVEIIYWKLTDLKYFCNLPNLGTLEEKFREITNFLKDFLKQKYEKATKTINKSLLEENELLEADLISFKNKYYFNSAFINIRKEFLPKDHISHIAYINYLNQHVFQLLKDVSIETEEKIRISEKKFKKAYFIIKNHPDNDFYLESQIFGIDNNRINDVNLSSFNIIKSTNNFNFKDCKEKSRLLTNDEDKKEFSINSFLVDSFEELKIKIEELKKPYRTLLKEQKYDELFELHTKLMKIIKCFAESDSGFRLAASFYIKLKKINCEQNENIINEKFDMNHNCNLDLLDQYVENLNAKSINQIYEVKQKSERTKTEEYLRSLLGANNYIEVILSEIQHLIYEINDVFDVKDEMLDKKITDRQIELVKNNLEILDKMNKSKVNQILQSSIVFTNAAKFIATNLNMYLEKLSEKIRLALEGNNNQKMNENESILRQTTSMWEDDNPINEKISNLKHYYENFIQIKKIEELIIYSNKSLNDCENRLKNFLFDVESSIYDLFINLERNLNDSIILTKNVEKLKKNIKILQECNFLQILESKFIENLCQKCASHILSFVKNHNYFNIGEFDESFSLNETDEIVRSINNLTRLYCLKEIFPELLEFEVQLACFQEKCEKILQEIEQLFINNTIHSTEENIKILSLPKQKTHRLLELSKSLRKLESPLKKKFDCVYNKILVFLKNYGENIIKIINSLIQDEVLSDIYSDFNDKIIKLVNHVLKALNEYNIIVDNHSQLSHKIFNKDNTEKIWGDLLEFLNYKIKRPILEDLSEGTNIKDNKFDAIPKILEVFCKFDKYDKILPELNFKELTRSFQNLKVEKIPNEKKEVILKIEQNKFEELEKYLNNANAKNSTETKKKMYQDYVFHLNNSIEKILKENEKIIKKLNSEIIQSNIDDISLQLKYLKEIKDCLKTHIEESVFEKVCTSYNNTIAQLNTVFQDLIKIMKSNIENYFFQSFFDKKTQFKNLFYKVSEYFDKSSNESYLSQISEIYENKFKSLCNDLKCIDNYTKRPPKNIFENFKNLSDNNNFKNLSTEEQVNILNSKRTLEKIIIDTYNESIANLQQKSVIDREMELRRIKNSFNNLPKDLENELNNKVNELYDNLNQDKTLFEQTLIEYINNKKYYQINEDINKIGLYDKSQALIRKVLNFLQSESNLYLSEIEKAYNENNFDTIFKKITQYHQFYSIFNSNPSVDLLAEFNKICKFLEDKIQENKRFFRSSFSLNEIRNKVEFSGNNINFNFNDSQSFDNIQNFSFQSEDEFRSNFLFFSKCLEFRKKNFIDVEENKIDENLTAKYLSSFELTYIKIMDFIQENVQNNIITFENSLINEFNDIENLSFAHANFMNWEPKIACIKNKFFEKNYALLREDDMTIEAINKFISLLKNYDPKTHKDRLETEINNLISTIVNFNIMSDVNTKLDLQRKEFYEGLKKKFTLINKLVEKNLCNKHSINNIIQNFTNNLDIYFEKANNIIKNIDIKKHNFDENDIRDLDNTFRNLNSLNESIGTLLIKFNCPCNLGVKLNNIQHELEIIFTRELDSFFEQMNKFQDGNNHLNKLRRNQSDNNLQAFNIVDNESIINKLEDHGSLDLAEVSRILIKIKKYSENLSFIKNIMNRKIDLFLQNLQNITDDKIIIQKLGQVLDSHPYGKYIIDDHKIFDGYLDIIYINMLKNFGINKVLETIEAQTISINAQNQYLSTDTKIDKSKLKFIYEDYMNKFDELLKANLKTVKKYDQLLNNLRLEISKLNIKHFKDKIKWSREMVVNIPDVLAFISVIWVICINKYYFNLKVTDRDEKYLKMPHTSQICAIFSLLCVDRADQIFINNLTQIGTGEGKSLVLAFTCAILALYGFDVSVVCYSTNLSGRDYNEFLEFFQILGVSDYISYGDFNYICQKFLNKNGDIREKTKQTLFNSLVNIENDSNKKNLNKINNKDKKNDEDIFRPSCLLIDEVDVFFSKNFMGDQYVPSFNYHHEWILDLFDFIWHEKDKYFDFQNNKNEESMNKEEYNKKRYHKYSEFKNYIEISNPYKVCCKLFQGNEALLNEILKDILYDLMEYKSHSEYIVENDKIAYKDQDNYVCNIRYRYKTIFAYYEEYNKRERKISHHSLRENVGFIIQCGYFSYAEIPKKFDYIMGVSGTLRSLSDSEKNMIIYEYKILRFLYMPSVFGDKKTRLDFSFNSEYIGILKDKEAQFKLISDKVRDKIGSKQLGERCIIIFFEKISDLEEFANSPYFISLDRKYKILTEKASKNEKDAIIRYSCQSGSITLSTRSFGRGIDFIVKDENINIQGGMYIIQAFLSEEKSEEEQIIGRTARQGKKGTFNLIITQQQLENMNIKIEGLNEENYNIDMKKTFDKIDEKRKKFYDIRFKENLKAKDIAKLYHEKSEVFLKNLKEKNIEEIKKYIFDINKGVTFSGQYVCRTKIFLDGTYSMDCLIDKAKTVIQSIFTRTFEILSMHDIKASTVSIQIGVFRNYDCSEEDIFECSPWESKPDNLINFLKKIQCKGGWGNEAIEIPFWDIIKTLPYITQAIIIGDRRANKKEEIAVKRNTSSSSYKGNCTTSAEYWAKSKYNQVVYSESYLEEIRRRKIKLHGFWIENNFHNDQEKIETKKFFDLLSSETGGKVQSLNLSDDLSSEYITNFIAEEILRNIGQNSDNNLNEKLVDDYKKKFKSYI